MGQILNGNSVPRCLLLGVLVVGFALLGSGGTAFAATGTISTVAGDATVGYSGDSGPATSAELAGPQEVAVDASGDLLIADVYNNRIRLVAAAACSSGCPYGLPSMIKGDIYTVAGNGTSGYSGDSGPATSAELEQPWGVAIDASGDLLIADTDGERVRLVAAAACSSGCPYGLPSMIKGDIYTVAGVGTGLYSPDGRPAIHSGIYAPVGLAVDASGDLLIADVYNNRIRLVAAAACSSGCPYGLPSMIKGDIYTVAGDGPTVGSGTGGYSGDSGPATSAGLNEPFGVAVDASGDLLIADTMNQRVRLVAAVACSSGCPYGLPSMTQGDIYTVAGTGTAGYSGDSGAATSADLHNPEQVAVDARGDLLIADTLNSRIRLVAAAACSSGCPYGLPSMTQGDIYTVAGTGTAGYSGDPGAATSAELNQPGGVAVGAPGSPIYGIGDLLIADTQNSRIRLVRPASLSVVAPSSVPVVGSAVSASDITATLSGSTPSSGGMITFKVFGPQSSAPSDCSGGSTVGTATVSGNGSYSPSAGFTPPAAGDYWWYASYGGDSSNNAASSACGALMTETMVGAASPSLGSVSAPSSGTAGTAVSSSVISAALSGGFSPSGMITFKVFGPQSTAPSDCSLGTTVGTATVSGNGTYSPSAGFTPPAAGDYWWYASYGGDSSNSPASSACGALMTETMVGAASPSLGSVSAPSSGTAGTAVSSSVISAALSGGFSPSGTISFKVFGPQSSAPSDCSLGTTVGTATVSGNGTYSPSAGFTPPAAGDYWWYASYGGDSSNSPASSGCGGLMVETVVGAASPSVSVGAPASGTAGAAISSSMVSGVLSGGASPSGTITFTVFGPQSSPPSDCSGGSTVGTATVSAGNGTYSPSAGFTPPAAGDYWWYASYGGDSSNNTATSGCGGMMVVETVVGAASPSVSVSAPASGRAGTKIGASSVSAGLSGGASPSGTITFTVFGPQSSPPSDCSGGSTVGTATVSAGNRRYSPSTGFTPSAVGDYWWYASYGGDPNNNSADSGCGGLMVETVVAKASSVTRSAVHDEATHKPWSGREKAGASAYDTATVSGSGARPSGKVTYSFFKNPGCSGRPSRTQQVTLRATGTVPNSTATGPLTAGSFSFKAAYSGDTNHLPSHSSCEPFKVL